ncbi:DUF726 domain-containing protein [Thorsellia anophelis]|uniref:DUF726 domain-containing protein n=1 Tax=Thorsellia anophelis DSM 18579 TaxID=1123402 RepID=A0A1I0DUM5_9GAMM|nr:DUF726 domain-containing protein [Thorsellia anophelis]SET36345.1 Protein of unknown function [Thorsellia anophelis DSM 18579]
MKNLKDKFKANPTTQIEISSCNEIKNAPVNVYIHGYAAFYFKVDEQKFKDRLSTIEGKNNLFVRWPSEHFSSAVINGVMKGVNLNQFKKFTSAKSTLVNISIPLLLIGVEAVTQIKKVQRKTHLLDVELIEKLEQFLTQNNLLNQKINFIAHSFGARLLINALENEVCQAFFKTHNVDNIVLMGGAICREKVNWEKVLTNIEGEIHNCHSKQDLALLFKPDLEKTIGRYPIILNNLQTDRIKNHHFEGFDHKSYWRNLDKVLTTVKLEPANFTFNNDSTLMP